MKNYFRVPRIMLPRDNYQYWAIPPIDRLTEREWEELARNAGDNGSLMSCIVPDSFTELVEGDESIFEIVKNSSYHNLLEDKFERLYRGAIQVYRETTRGERRGIVLNLDLEAFEDPENPVRFSTGISELLAARRLAMRRESILEFPHTVLLYRDRRDKVLHSAGKNRELLYEFPLAMGGGEIWGCFIPDQDMGSVFKGLLTRTNPFFVVADGNHSLAAARRYWLEVRESLSEERRLHHPARFTLVECICESEPGVYFEPIHRLIEGIDVEAFCDYFLRRIKGKREGNVLQPILKSADDFCKADAIISEFLRQNSGEKSFTSCDPAAYKDREDSVVVAFPAVEKGELFKAAKSGKTFPAKSFSFCKDRDARYCFEGREITYD